MRFRPPCIHRVLSTLKRVLCTRILCSRLHTIPSRDLQGPNQKVSWFIEIFIANFFARNTLEKERFSRCISSLAACFYLGCCKYAYIFFHKIWFRNFILNFRAFFFFLVKLQKCINGILRRGESMLKNSCIKCVASINICLWIAK